jgi:anti-anti-sigma factor
VTERLAELELDERDGVLVAQVAGEIDASNTTDLRLALTERLGNSGAGLVIDLSDVTYIDSAGIKLLFDLASRLAARRQAIRLVVPEGVPTRRVLELCGVGQVAPIDSRLDASVAAVAGSV